jgi:membrane fusion protein (multidrug efflux system)
MRDEAITREVGQRRTWRGIGLGAIAVLCLLGGIGYGIYWYNHARFHQKTDDAYVAGNVVAVTSRENATVTALLADNTQTVRRGQLLVEMDPSRAEIGMSEAQANLARVVRSVRGAFASADTFQAQLAQAQVQLAAARSDYQRRQSAMAGAVSREEVAHARDSVAAAEAAVNAARSGLAQARASIAGADVSANPDVLAAAAQLRAAAIVLSHMKLVAPVDGVVAQRTVQVGQRIAAGQPVMSVVQLHNVWIDANFKEVQLARMRIGQPVRIVSDIYGGDVVYRGRILGLGAGSGSAFALLPPQNASGNWIKIVQRVPVRIAIDPQDLKAHPLRIGLSVTADVDISDQSGTAITNAPAATEMRVDSDDTVLAQADALIARIIAANRSAP